MSRASNNLPKLMEGEKKKYPRDETGKRIVTKMTEKAWDILNLQLTSKGMSLEDIAQEIGSSRVYVSRIVNSPCYIKEITDMRRQRIHDELNLAMCDGVDRMRMILTDEESADANAIAAFKAVAQSAGFGQVQQAQGQGGTNVQVNLGVTAEMIQEANARRKQKIFEADYSEVKDEQEE